jgi:pSer/pThr/pTyr-binding forkhead associated (FHA) protein
MAVRLTVKQRSEAGGAEKPSALLLEDEIITLGRDAKCQVVLAQQAVSRNHARISRDGSLFFVEDLGSAYGTQINGSKLPKGEKHLLRNGDVIAIAQFDVTFDRVAEGQNHHETGNTQFVARQVVKDVMRGLGTSGELPYFRVMNGPREGQRIEISDAKEYVIGREEGVEIVLKDDLVSRRHVKIRRDWSGTHAEDLGSRNGFKINKKKTQKKTLKDRDELEVGGIRLLYIDPSEVRESPLVLPNSDDDEQTIAPPPDPPASKRARSVAEAPAVEELPPPETAPEPEPDSDAEPAGDEPPPEGQEAEGDETTAAEGEGEAFEDQLPEHSEQTEAGGGLSDKRTLLVLGVVGLIGLVAIVFLILLLVGA